LLAGPMADFVLEPAMLPGGALAGSLDWLVGTGTGSGMALIIIISGVGAALVGLGAYSFRHIRDVEDILPDHQQGVDESKDGIDFPQSDVTGTEALPGS